MNRQLTLCALALTGIPMCAAAESTADRRHWISDLATITSGAANQWAENSEPGPGEYAVFNADPQRNLSLSLDADRLWRGLIVDGERLSLDLAGNTLTLTTNGPSTNEFNISVGETFYRDSTLAISNGFVRASKPIVVGRVALTGNALNAALGFGAAVDVKTPAVIVGGPPGTRGTLYIDKAATLQTERLDLGLGRGSEASVSMQGALRVTGPTTTIGREGGVEMYVHNGASADWGNTLVEMNSGREQYSSLHIRDETTRSVGGSFSLGYGTALSIGYGMNFTTHGVITAHEGGAFSVDNASASVSKLELLGGAAYFSNSKAQATITNAILSAGSLRILADAFATTVKILQPTVVSNSVEIDYGILEAANIRIGPPGQIRGNYGTLKSLQPVISDGLVYPGSSLWPQAFLTIDAPFEQTDRGTLIFEISSPNEDRLTVLGATKLNGLVIVRFEGAYSPKVGETFTLLESTGPLTGSPTIQIEGIEPGWQYESSLAINKLTLRSLSNGRGIGNYSGPDNYEINFTLTDTTAETFALVAGPAHGRIVGTYPNLWYASDPGFSGRDSIRYRNSAGLETTIQFTIQARPVMPTITVGVPSEIIVEEGQVARLTGTFTDPDGHGAVTIFSPFGTVSHNSSTRSWTWTYKTTDGPDNSRDFSIVAEDEVDYSLANIRLTVLNVAPTAHSQTITRTDSSPIAIQLTSTDPGNDSLIYQIVTPPARGSISGAAPFITYTPEPNSTGGDSFTFKSIDSDGAESEPVEIRIVDLRLGPEPLESKLEGGNITVKFQGVPGLTYRIESADNLNSPIAWTNTGAIFSAPQSGVFSFTDTASVAGARFYRAVPNN